MRSTGSRRIARGILFPLATVLVVGCAATAAPSTPQRTGPEQLLRRYMEAIRQGDARAAYALLDERTRQRVSFDEFREQMKHNQAELRDQAAQLEQHLESGVQPHARIRIDPGPDVVFVRANGTWQLDSGVFEAPTLRTPRDAVLALRRALQRRSLHAIQRVLSRRTRAELEAEIRRFLEQTADEHDLRYEVHGDTATVHTTGERVIELRREAGEWRVIDVAE